MGSRGAPHLVLSNGAAFAVMSPSGDIRREDNPESGLFYDDTRYLSRSTLEIRGAGFRELSSEVTREYVSQVDLSLSGEAFGGELDDPKLAFHLRRRQLIDRDMVERIELSNYHHAPDRLQLVFRHDADFKDLFEVRGWTTVAARATLHPPEVVDAPPTNSPTPVATNASTARASATSARPTRSSRGSPASACTSSRSARGPRDAVTVGRDEVDRPRAPAPFRATCSASPKRTMRGTREATRVATDDDYFTQSIDRGCPTSIRSAYASTGMTTVTAGIPWFAAPFGRDGLISRSRACSSIRRRPKRRCSFCSRYQGKEIEPRTRRRAGQDPARVPARRDGSHAARSRTGPITVRSTRRRSSSCSLDEYVNFTNDLELVGTSGARNLEAAVRWILRPLRRRSARASHLRVGHGGRLRNQGWKDSSDGICFPDGRLVSGPIALVEVQGYAVDGLERAARLLARVGQARARASRRGARGRAPRAIDTLFFDETGCVALAIDGEGTPVMTQTSNPGHLLFSRP